MSSQSELESAVRKTIALHNRLHGDKAFARLVFLSLDLFVVSFSGSFCYNCDDLGFLRDFVNEFKIFDKKKELKIGRPRQTGPRSFEVDFLIASR